MRMITRKKPAFTELYQTGVFNFCASCGISLWEVHNKVAEKAPE